jgi:uncharacterized membrane protein
LDASAYWKYQMVAMAAVGFLMGLGFMQDNTVLIMIALAIAGSSILFLRRRVEEPLYDERSASVSRKASAAAFSAFTVGSLVVSALLFYLGNVSDPGYLQWAYGMAFIVCALMIFRLIFWIYYTWRLGG